MSDYFSGIANGRLPSGRFIVLWLLLLAAFFLLLVGVGAGLGVLERLIGGDLPATQKMLAERFGGAFAIVFLLLMAIFLFAWLNIIAKRARDVGLPGWLTAIVIFALSGGASRMADHGAVGSIGLLLVLILSFLPTGMLRKT